MLESSPPDKKYPQRDIADQMHSHRLLKKTPHFLHRLFLGQGGIRKVEVPIGLLFNPLVGKKKVMARREFVNPFKHGQWTGDEFVSQIIIKACKFTPRSISGIRRRALISEAKANLPLLEIIVKGFNPQPIPGDDQVSFFPIPKPDGKHSLKVGQKILLPFFVGMDNDLGIGMAPEKMSSFDQLFSQFQKIIDLSVKNQLDGSVFVTHGLVSLLGQIDDGQTTESKGNALFTKNTFLIRATMF